MMRFFSSLPRELPSALVTLCALAGVVAMAGTGLPASTSLPAGPAHESEATPAPGTAGLQVAIDPETGALVMPTAEAAKVLSDELMSMLSRSTQGLVEEALPRGGVKVHLQGRFQNASLAHVDEQGRLHLSCVDGHEAAQATLSACRHDSNARTPEVR